jgi:hypothetical protein
VAILGILARDGILADRLQRLVADGLPPSARAELLAGGGPNFGMTSLQLFA